MVIDGLRGIPTNVILLFPFNWLIVIPVLLYSPPSYPTARLPARWPWLRHKVASIACWKRQHAPGGEGLTMKDHKNAPSQNAFRCKKSKGFQYIPEHWIIYCIYCRKNSQPAIKFCLWFLQLVKGFLFFDQVFNPPFETLSVWVDWGRVSIRIRHKQKGPLQIT